MPSLTSLWGWLFALCLTVLVGCSVLAVDAHNTINEYKALRASDISMMRREIVNANLAQTEQLRNLLNNNSEQLKQYVDIQIPRQVQNTISSITPITIQQTASPAITASPTIHTSNNKRK